MDNTNWKGRQAGRAGGPCFQMKNVNFRRAAQKTEGRAGGLHKKAVQRAVDKGVAGCKKGKPSSPPFSAAQLTVQPFLMCSPLARPVVQPASPPFCAARRARPEMIG